MLELGERFGNFEISELGRKSANFPWTRRLPGPAPQARAPGLGLGHWPRAPRGKLRNWGIPQFQSPFPHFPILWENWEIPILLSPFLNFPILRKNWEIGEFPNSVPHFPISQVSEKIWKLGNSQIPFPISQFPNFEGKFGN